MIDFNRHEIGSWLLEAAEEKAEKRGLKKVYVYLGNDYLESKAFYPKHGYIEYKELYLNN